MHNCRNTILCVNQYKDANVNYSRQHKIKQTYIDRETGQFSTISLETALLKYPKRGTMATFYIESSLEVIAGLSKKEARFLSFLLKERDMYNIILCKISSIAKQEDFNWSRQYLYKVMDKFRDLNIIVKHKGKIWVNPYLILPIKNDMNPSNAWEVQTLWTYLFEDKDKWFDGIDKLEKNIFG